jgi:hypothetical protein
MCPFKQPTSRPEILWSEWGESVRKDVECFFGILKARFWFSAETIQDAFRCCAILHKMLLAYDGYLDEVGDGGVQFWEHLYPDAEDIDALYEEYRLHAGVEANEVLDCYNTMRRGQCLASFANSPLHARNSQDVHERVTENCGITRDYQQQRIALKCTARGGIAPHTELLWRYGVSYKFRLEPQQS